MWFGNLATMKWWDDLWLNESFATFISHLCMSSSADLNKTYTTSWLLFGNYKGLAYRADQQSTTHPVMSDVKNTEIAETHFDEIVYEKGSSILKQMYYFIGDESFSKGLKSYFQKYQWGNTVFDDFIHQMIEAIGHGSKFNLKDLSHSWLKKSGLNELEVVMETDNNNKITRFEIIQTPCLKEHPNRQTHIFDLLFIHNIDSNSFSDHRKIILTNEEINSFTNLIGQEAPNAVILNYNDWAYFKWVIDTKSVNYLKNNLHKINDLLTKQLVYRSVFDLVRDARLPAPEYLNFVSNLITKETNEDIIATVLRNVQGIISSYVPLSYYEKYTDKMFKSISELLAREIQNYNNQSGNKDLILHLFDFLVGFTYGDTNTNILASWLTETKPKILNETFDINLLSQENRFKIVNLIFKSRKVTDEEKEKYLSNEVARDKNSDRSTLYKLACYASKPDPKIKEELWQKFVYQSTCDSLYNMEALMGGFSSRDQLDLVQDYLLNKFFEVVPEVGRSNEFLYVRAFVTCLSPSYYVNEDTINKLENLAERIKDLDQVHKEVIELADDLKRCLKAHKLCEK